MKLKKTPWFPIEINPCCSSPMSDRPGWYELRIYYWRHNKVAYESGYWDGRRWQVPMQLFPHDSWRGVTKEYK